MATETVLKVKIDDSDIKKTGKSINQLESEFKTLEDKLKTLPVGSKSFVDMKKKVDTAKIALDGLKQSSEQTRNNIKEVGLSVVGAFGNGIGLISSFAGENKELAAILVSVQRAQQATAVAQEALNGLTAASKILTERQAIAQATQATTSKAAAVATNILSGAVKALLGPIGLVIAGVGVVVAIFASFSKSSKELVEESNKQSDAIRELAESYIELSDKQREQSRLRIKDEQARRKQELKDEITSAKERASAVISQKVDTDVELLKFDGFKNEELSKGDLELKNELIKRQQKFAGELIDAENRITKANEELRKQREEANKKTQEDNQKAYLEYLDLLLRQFNAAKDLEAQRLALNNDFNSKRRLIEIEHEKQLEEIRIKELKGEIVLADEKTKINVEYGQKILVLEKELATKRNEIIEQSDDIRLEQLIEQLSKTSNVNDKIIAEEQRTAEAINDINDQLAKDIAENPDLKLELEQKANQQIIIEEDKLLQIKSKLNQDYNNQKARDIQSLSELELTSLNEINSALDKSFQDRIDANNKLTTIQIKRIELERDIALQNKELTQDQIDLINAQANQQINSLNKISEKQKEILQNQADFAQAIGASTKEDADKFVTAFGQVAQASSKLPGQIGQDLNAVFSSLESAFKKLSDGIKLNGADIAQTVGAIATTINNSILQAIQQGAADRSQAIDEEIANNEDKLTLLDEEANDRTNRIGELEEALGKVRQRDRERILNQIAKEKEAEINLANAKKQIEANNKQLEEEKKQLQRKVAEGQKAASLAQAIINGAVAITTALAQLGPIGGPIAAGLIGGITAAQIGIIANQPIPEFDTGGFTGKGNKYDIAGIVHKGEYVVPKEIVESPNFKSNIAELEYARTKKHYAEGGGGSTSIDVNPIINKLDENAQAMIALSNRPIEVSVKQITDEQDKTKKIKTRAII